MTSLIYKMRGRGSSGAQTSASTMGKRLLTSYSTTATERFLLMVTVVLFPLQNHLPAIAGASILFIVFAILFGYTVLYRSQALAKMATCPVFLAAYVLLAVALLIESGHPDPDYIFIFRMGQMIIGAMIAASLCRDQPALRFAAYGYLIAGIWMSVLLFFSSYGALREVTATDFQEASRIRGHTFEHMSFEANLNFMGFVAAQGTAVALALAMAARSYQRRYFFLGIAVLCFVATFLPMSRSAVAIVILTSAIIILAYGVKHMMTFTIAIILGVSLVVLVPGVVFSRLKFSTEVSNIGRMDSRAYVYTTALKHLPEYVLTGVGVGNYFSQWGAANGFVSRGGVMGPHSWYFAITIYWGLAGLLALVAFIYQAYRCLPRRCGASPLGLCILGIVTSVFLYMFLSHVLNGKEVAIALGLLAASRYWIWPSGMVLPAARGRWPIRRAVRPVGAFEKP